MIFILSDTFTVGFTTIFGVNVGFEILSKRDFEKTGLPMKWSVMINLFALRLTLTKYQDEE